MTWIPKPYIPTTEEITLDKSMSKLASVGNLLKKDVIKKEVFLHGYTVGVNRCVCPVVFSTRCMQTDSKTKK